MRLAWDIDGTLCTNTDGKYYTGARPYKEMIDLVNELYDAGHYIIIHTARGMGKHNNIAAKASTEHYAATQSQLNDWGVKYHELHLGKIHVDVYFDDRGFRLNEDGSSVNDVRNFLKSNFNLEGKDE